MSEMERGRFEELKEAYVLDALPEEERREFEEYLATHPERRAQIDELNAVADLLALSPEEHEPSPALRREGRRLSLMRLREFFGLRGLALAAAALLIGLLSWNMLLRSEIQGLQNEVGELRAVELQGSALPEEASAEIVRLENEKAFLIAEDLPAVGEGETLQIWVIDDDGPKPSGLFEPREAVVTVPVTRSLKGAEVVAVTIEPEGGSPRPTRKPIMAAKI